MTTKEITLKLQECGMHAGISINSEFVKNAIDDVRVFGYAKWESSTCASKKMKEFVKSISI